jgi:hypothetical protein
VSLLLSVTDEAGLRRAVDQVGGFERARRVLYDEAKRLQGCADTGSLSAMVAVFHRVEALARDTTG